MDFALTDIFNLIDILHRASQHQPLTPSERAWAKGAKGVMQAVIITLLLAGAQYLASHDLGAINVRDLLDVFMAVATKAFLDAYGKFHTAQAPSEVQTGNIMGSVARGFGAVSDGA